MFWNVAASDACGEVWLGNTEFTGFPRADASEFVRLPELIGGCAYDEFGDVEFFDVD